MKRRFPPPFRPTKRGSSKEASQVMPIPISPRSIPSVEQSGCVAVIVPRDGRLFAVGAIRETDR